MRYILPLLLALLLGACSDRTTPTADGALDDQGPADGATADKKVQPDKKAPLDKTGVSESAPFPDQALLLDLPKDLAKLKDLAQPKDLSNKDASMGFLSDLEGIWLVGWIGGLNRFSWVKFQASSVSGGDAWILDGKGLSGGTVPYLNCTGKTTFNLASKPNTVQLHMPGSNCNGYKSTSYTFTNIKAMTASYPKGATHQATVTASNGSPTTVSGYKFPASQCDSLMTKCTDPL
jgi:hypothetical protein